MKLIAPITVVLMSVALAAGCGDSNTGAASDTGQDTDTGPNPLIETLGPWAVGHRRVEAIDIARGNRALPVDIWYPVDAEDAEHGDLASYPLEGAIRLPALVAIADAPVSQLAARPLIIFSHGFEAVNTQSTPLTEALASYGYVVISPEHIGNSQGSPGDSFEDAAQKRFDDVSFLIDYMTARVSDVSDDFYGAIDATNVGVTGHSMGGFTAMAAATGYNGVPAEVRVKAIAPISGAFTGNFAQEQLESVSVPVLLLGGTLDTSVPIVHNEFAFAHLPTPVYQVNIIGATHTHFANICDIGNTLIRMGFEMEQWPDLGAEALVAPYNETCSGDALPVEEALRLQNLYVTAFFNVHLLALDDFAGILTNDYATSHEAGVNFTSK